MTRPGASASPLSTIMSGNFDFPPARSSSSSVSPVDFNIDSATLPGRFQREEARARRMLAQQPPATVQAPMPPRRRRTSRRATDESSREGSTGAQNPPPLSSSRPRAIPGERYQAIIRRQRQQQRDEEGRSLMTAVEDARRPRRHITNELSQNQDHQSPALGSLSRFSQLTLPQTESFGMDHLDRSYRSSERPERRASKRRKLEKDPDYTEPYAGFKYGHCGQVVPGRLKMEVARCDGGEYDGDSDMPLYQLSNVLRKDKSVYCTEKPICNLLLRHQGETTFAIDKIVIAAPKRGFTAPVQEGLIFAGHSERDVMKQGERYVIREPHSRYRSSRSVRLSPDDDDDDDDDDEGGLTLLQSLRDPEVWEGSRQARMEREERERIERDEARTRQRFDQMQVTQPDETRSRARDLGAHCEWPFPDEEEDYSTLVSFVATDGDLSSDDEEETSHAVLEDRRRRDTRWRGNYEIRGDDDEMAAAAFIGTSNVRSAIRAARQLIPRSIEPRADSADDVDPPSAFFFMTKSKVTIKFPTSLSARYVLLKLFSPLQLGGNIDIQNVSVYGFAGPRFVPACELR